MSHRILTAFAHSKLMSKQQRKWLEQHEYFIGDVHNHCAISYGHGELSDAIAFAKQQLDFFSVTGHFAWPDMETSPAEDAESAPSDELPQPISVPPEVADYHCRGFEKLREGWEQYRKALCAGDDSPSPIPFLSYEYHSFARGDVTVLLRDPDADLPEPVAPGLPDTRLDELIACTDAVRDGILCIPHHIGYRTGYRGIDWSKRSPQASPIVEIVSMHGCAESHEAPLPYLHTMGPRTGMNTMQGGLALGHRFGVIGSTDHHNASPGSYGFGRAAVWARERERSAIWDAMAAKATCALTGDRIEAALFVDGRGIGTEATGGGESSRACSIDAYVVACDVIDRIEIVKNNQVIAHVHPIDRLMDGSARLAGNRAGDRLRGRLSLSLGWGEKHTPCLWNAHLRLDGISLLAVDPRLRGEDIVDPLDRPDPGLSGNSDQPGGVQMRRAGIDWSLADGWVDLRAWTRGNPSAVTDATQGYSIELMGKPQSLLILEIEAVYKGRTLKRSWQLTLQDLVEQPQSMYIDGFVSPAVLFSKLIPVQAYQAQYHGMCDAAPGDWIYLRAVESRGDCVWTSPVWV